MGHLETVCAEEKVSYTEPFKFNEKTIYKQVGNAVVVLDAISANSECNTSKAYNYNVQAGDGIEQLSATDISAIMSNGSIKITNNTGLSYDVSLFTIDGKLIESE